MRTFLFRLLAIFFFDAAFVAGVYLALPDTRALLTGVQLHRVSGEGKEFDFLAGPKNKRYVPLHQIPRQLQAAIIQLEDTKFYEHRGFDYEEVYNAIEATVLRGRRLRGASTLSQQLVKNLYLTPERSLRRKLIEALITVKLEMTLSKRAILEIYLNSIDWGRGLLGVNDAASYYFRKRASQLSLKESVFLAAIIPNPARFGRISREQLPKRFVRSQMSKALQSLYRAEQITLEQYQEALLAPLEINN